MEKSPDYFQQYDKHLVIFDFDETLCKTNAIIRAKERATDREIIINATEYAQWRKDVPHAHELYDIDFSEFQRYPEKGELIEPVANKLKQYASRDNYIIALVTGRDNLAGPKQFLKDNYIPINKMFLMCSGDPNKKNCFRSLINTFEPEHVTIFEDTLLYIEQCYEVCCRFSVHFSAVLIKDGTPIYNWRKYERDS
jgi:hypothetical protein